MNMKYSDEFIKTIIRMAWSKNVSFEKIKRDKDLSESEVIVIMRNNLRPKIFKQWRKQVAGKASKHEKKTKILKKEGL